MRHAVIRDIATAVDIQPGAVVSKVVHHDEGANVTVFGFDAGQELTEHQAVHRANSQKHPVAADRRAIVLFIWVIKAMYLLMGLSFLLFGMSAWAAGGLVLLAVISAQWSALRLRQLKKIAKI